MNYSPNKDAIQDAQHHGSNRDNEINGDLAEADFESVTNGGPDFDWSDGYDLSLEEALNTFKAEFYLSLRQQQASGVVTDLVYLDSNRC